MNRRAVTSSLPVNPLLHWADRGFPDFSALSPEHLAPALLTLDKAMRAAVRQCVRPETALTWRARYEPVETAWARFEEGYRVALAASMLREEELGCWKQEAMDRADELNGWLGRHRGLRRSLRELSKSPRTTAWQRKVIAIGRFGGQAGLSIKAMSQKIQAGRQIHKLSEKFDDNARLSLAQSQVVFSERSEVAGIRGSLLAAGRERARQEGLKGWVFTPEDDQYSVFMSDCENRESRRRLYRARAQAASELAQPKHDNGPLIRRLLRLRKNEALEDKAPSYGHLKLKSHMAGDPETAESFLISLAEGARSQALLDRRELFEWTRDHEGARRLEPWDFYRAQQELMHERFGDSQLQAMGYFAVYGAIERTVAITAKIARCRGIRRRELETSPNLLVFEIRRAGKPLGHLSVSPFATSEKREGRMYEWDLRGVLLGEEQSASAMVFMQMPPCSRMAHSQVVELFHELGHAFHALLSRPKCHERQAAGLEWDAIETHSQLFEQLAWEPSILKIVGRRRGKPMPAKLIKTLLATRNFQSGATIAEQTLDALADLRLHSAFNPRGRKQPWEVFNKAREDVGVDSAKSYNREGNQLWTISWAAYASAGYAYLWSEALAVSVYERWREDCKGKLTDQKAAERLERLLFTPGSSEPMALMLRRHTEKQQQPALEALYRIRELKT